MITYVARVLLIGVCTLVVTFRAYRSIGRWSCVLFVTVGLMGVWLDCCFLFFISLDFGVGRSAYLILDLFIRLLQYIRILSYYILPFILYTLFCTDASLPRGLHSCMQVSIDDPVDLLSNRIYFYLVGYPLSSTTGRVWKFISFCCIYFFMQDGTLSHQLYLS